MDMVHIHTYVFPHIDGGIARYQEIRTSLEASDVWICLERPALALWPSKKENKTKKHSTWRCMSLARVDGDAFRLVWMSSSMICPQALKIDQRDTRSWPFFCLRSISAKFKNKIEKIKKINGNKQSQTRGWEMLLDAIYEAAYITILVFLSLFPLPSPSLFVLFFS